MKKLKRFAPPVLIIVLLLFLLPDIRITSQAEAALYHDSRDLVYRDPFGAVTTGTEVTLRLRASAGSVAAVLLRVFNFDTGQQAFYPMTKAVSVPEGIDYWEYKLKTPDQPTVLYYRFLVRRGGGAAYYEDDTKNDQGVYDIARKGGAGIELSDTRDQSWQITVYTPDFKTPQWMHDAILYQIFPDRFRDGDKSNDPQDGSQIFYGRWPLTFHKTWNAMVTDFRSDPALHPNSDFFGGDLKGIQYKLPYLKALGVTALYLNPIFEARSNHRYDTVDYEKIDPILGTLDDWNALVKGAANQGIHIVLDGVFNHVSSDGPYFDRYHRYPDQQGACENLNSPYRSWFFFRKPTPQEAKTARATLCVDDGQGNTYYDSWAGVDSIPRLNNTNPDVRQFIYGADDSVARTWIKAGASGWRLDVAGEIDDGHSANPFWEGFRKAVKSANPDAVIIAEYWNDASPWLTGTQVDSAMNYRLRQAILGFALTQPYSDNTGAYSPLTPSQFDGAIQSMFEDYPPQAMSAMMNLLGSHDTSRISDILGSDSQSQKLAAFIDFMLPGAPTIYYGDEIALKAPDLHGQADPYSRAPYPWPDQSGHFYPAPDSDMLAYYTQLAQVRAANPALRDGFYQTLIADNESGVYAFLRAARRDDVALVVANRSATDQSFTVNVPSCLDNGTTLSDALGGTRLTIKDGKVSGTARARSGEVFTGSITCLTLAPNHAVTAITTESPFRVDIQAGDGEVTLTFTKRDGVQYDVYRSYFPAAGFVKVNKEPVADVFEDTTVSNGTRYYYACDELFSSGSSRIDSPTGAVITTVPGASIKRVVLLSPDQSEKINTVLSLKGVNVTASPTFDSLRQQHVIAQVALAEPTTELATITTWQALTASSGQPPVYTATLRPTRPGALIAVARFSANAGDTWTYSNPLSISVAAPAPAPGLPAPANLKTGTVGTFNVTLLWNAVPGASVYHVYRGSGNNRALIGETDRPTFRDSDVIEGQDYQYSVTVIDNSLNESPSSAVLTVSVTAGVSTVTFTVTVPDNTPANSPLYLAGDFGKSDYPLWNPGGLKMNDLGNHTWQITLKLPQGATVQYKYVRGAWEAVEKGSACEEIANRTMLVKSGATTVSDRVARWRDVDKCG